MDKIATRLRKRTNIFLCLVETQMREQDGGYKKKKKEEDDERKKRKANESTPIVFENMLCLKV